MYDLKAQSDAMRLTRHTRVYGNAICPVTENKVCVILSDGRLLHWQLTAVDFKVRQFYVYFRILILLAQLN